jgi:hypothetical protein
MEHNNQYLGVGDSTRSDQMVVQDHLTLITLCMKYHTRNTGHAGLSLYGV